MELIKTKGYESRPEVVLILAHGAGAPADSTFMEELSLALSREGIVNVRFEFPYMQKRRVDGRKRPPDREPALLAHFSRVVDVVRAELGAGCKVLVGGKSMGGRMASILASQRSGIDGVTCFGYPFHPPGKLDRWRTGHFQELKSPMLVLQGTRDPFGKRAEMAGHEEELAAIRLHWLEGGNHDFQPLKSQPHTQSELIAEAARETRAFVDQELAT
ncbi:MAG: alpha/beta family hydrolase [Marinobacter sp.]|nr:alpha/beta family hydrolase [Marinobacter sp.]